MSREAGAAYRGAAPRLRQRGMATVELAIGLTAIAGLLITLVGIVALGSTQAAAANASHEIARQLARGDDAAAAEAEEMLPPGADFTVAKDAQGVSVRVHVPAPVFGLGSVPLEAEGWARWEPGVEP